jgi:hypothetical protein
VLGCDLSTAFTDLTLTTDWRSWVDTVGKPYFEGRRFEGQAQSPARPQRQWTTQERRRREAKDKRPTTKKRSQPEEFSSSQATRLKSVRCCRPGVPGVGGPF